MRPFEGAGRVIFHIARDAQALANSYLTLEGHPNFCSRNDAEEACTLSQKRNATIWFLDAEKI